jgi:uncharacterized protein
LQPFVPIVANNHLLTIAGNFWPRTVDTVRFPVDDRLYRTEPGVQVRVQSQFPEAEPKAEMVLVHGLEGSGESGYMRSLTQAGLEAGYAMHRFHMRTCGGTAHLSPTLYHAGMTSDLHAVLRMWRAEGRGPFLLAGFSLGANVVLKLAGELGHSGNELLLGAIGISAPIDLSACTHRMRKLDNLIYDRRFVRRMRERLISTGRYTARDFRGVRTIWDVDEKITAPSFGFRGAEHYYATQSCQNFLHAIRVPALLIQAKDDTFIPFRIFDHPAIRTNPHLKLEAIDHGGHLGFLSRRRPRFWLDGAILEWTGRLVETPAALPGRER